MHFSFLRAFQWIGIAVVLAAVVGLNYDFESDAKVQMNSAIEDPLSQSLLGYWKLDEGTGTSTTADSSGNATTLTMTVMDSGDWVTGQIGPYSLDFDGTAEYLTAADPAILDFADGASFTLTGWFNRDLAADDDTIIAKKTNQTTNVGYTVWIDNNGSTDYLFFEASDGTDTYQIQSTTDFSTTGWHHFAISWNDNSSLTTPVNLYIDGALNNGATSGTFANVGDLSASNTNAFRIGAESGTADSFFDGKLDDIRVYGYPLSASDVSKLYQTTAPAQPVDTGLVGHWTFDGTDIQGTTVIDRSGKGNNGTATGTTKTIGKLGQGLSFNGTSDVVNITGLSLPDWQTASGYTISMWVKDFPDDIQDIALFEMWNSGDNNERIRLSSSDFIPYQRLAVFAGREYSAREGESGYEDLSVEDIAKWHHLVVTANSTKLALFNNSAEVASDTSIITYGSFTFNSIRIGGGASNYYGNASATYAQTLIDDVRVYNRTLSGTEIANLYNAGK